MQLELDIAAAGAGWRWTPRVRAGLNAGWAGRGIGGVRAHVADVRSRGGPMGELLPPDRWLTRLWGRLPESDAGVLSSGTVPTREGALRYGDGFRVGLEAPRLGRSVVHEYDIALVDNPLA